MTDFIIVAILLAVIGAAVIYIVKAKKSGVKCIGCPSGGCSKSKVDTGCTCGCGTSNDCNCQSETK